MRCPKCGAKNDPDAGFCENCGEKLTKAEVKEKKIKKIEKPEKKIKETAILLGDYKFGGFWMRFLARIIDSLILGVPTAILISILSFISYGAGFSSGSSSAGVFGGIMIVFLILIMFLINILYFVILDGTGGTLGKRICGLRVINQDGENLGIGKSVLRHFVYSLLLIIPWVGGLVYMIGYIAISWDKQKQGWHDKIAGSFVVYKGKK